MMSVMVHSPAPSPVFEGIATADESRFLLGSVLDEADDNRQQRAGTERPAHNGRQDGSSSSSSSSGVQDFQLQQATSSSASQSPATASMLPSSIISTLRTVNSSAASSPHSASSPSSPLSPGSASASSARSAQRLLIQPSWLQGHRLDDSATAAGLHSADDGAASMPSYALKGSPPLIGSGRFSPPSASSFFSQSPADAVSPAAFANSLQSAEVDQLTARLQQLRMQQQQQQQQAAMSLNAAEEAAGSQAGHGDVYALNSDGAVRLRSVGSAPHVMMLRGDEEDGSGYGLFEQQQQQQHRLQLQCASPLSLAELRSSYSPPPARHQRASSLTPSYPNTRPSSSSMPSPQSLQQQQQQQQAALESQLLLQSQPQRQNAALFEQPRQRSYSQSQSSSSLRSTSVPDYYRPPHHGSHHRNSSPSHAQTVHGSASSSPYSLSPASSGYSEQSSRLSRPSSLSSLSSFPPSPSLFSQQYASSSLSSILQRGLFLDLCMDQYGSRYIQQKLDSCTDEERHAAFLLLTQDADQPQLSPHGHNLVVSLSIDVFANYAVQKMMEVADEAEQSRLCCCLLGSVVLLSLQVYGCRVVQKAIETSHPSLQLLLISELDADVLQLITDQNGNHVVQKVIEQCPPPMLDFVLERTRGHVHRLATHPYGCRVIQRLLEHGSDRQRLLIMDEVILSGAGQGGDDVLLELMRSSFGNYVAQGTLVHGNDWHRHRMCQVVRGRVCALSKHKFASNVMEKCLVHATRDDQQLIIDEIMGPQPDDERADERGQHSAAAYGASHHGPQSPFLELCSDPYGNYMCQRLLNVIEDEQRVDLLWRLEHLLPQLKKIPYGKHILARIERMSFAANTRGIAAINAHCNSGSNSGVVELKDTRASRRAGGAAAASRDNSRAAQQPHSGNWTAAGYPPGLYVNNASQSGSGGGGGVGSSHGSHSRFAGHHANASKHSFKQ